MPKLLAILTNRPWRFLLKWPKISFVNLFFFAFLDKKLWEINPAIARFCYRKNLYLEKFFIFFHFCRLNILEHSKKTPKFLCIFKKASQKQSLFFKFSHDFSLKSKQSPAKDSESCWWEGCWLWLRIWYNKGSSECFSGDHQRVYALSLIHI